MLLTLRTTHRPATDLGYLLRKHPDRAHEVSLPFGRAHVVWPEAEVHAATAALVLDIDPIALVRGRPSSAHDGPLDAYVNDRPYVASSFLSVALARVFRSALHGRAPEHPDLVDTPLPLELELPAVVARGGQPLLARLFEPLGWAVEASRWPCDETVPAWGDSSVYRVRLAGPQTVKAALQHLYVLLPVLDDDKHYWVGAAEVDNLVAKSEDWLPDHPERELIAQRYLKHRRGLTRQALARLTSPDEVDDAPAKAEEALEKPLSLQGQRIQWVLQVVRDAVAEAPHPLRVVDLGCGEGKLLDALVRVHEVAQLVGVDVSGRALDRAEARLARRTGTAERVTLLHGSALYRDPRLDGADVLLMVEVVEHVEPGRLPALVRAVFGGARPTIVAITTPNAEYNPRLGLAPGRWRHADHRFEWTRGELAQWCHHVCAEHGYSHTIEGIGDPDPEVGAPTQAAVFRRQAAVFRRQAAVFRRQA